MAGSKRAAVILAGGSGTRFWPMSQEGQPKQYLRLFGDRSLIQHTWDRVCRLSDPHDVFVCTASSQKEILSTQLPDTKVILEPAARNTAPAVLLSALTLLREGYSPSTVMAVFPADHFIADNAAFDRLLNQAYDIASETSGLVTLGIVPTSPHTGYGYIEAGERLGSGASKVARFVEKPDEEKARAFLKQGTFFWNSGIFVWRLDAIVTAFDKYAPEDSRRLQGAKSPSEMERAYESVSRTPVDKAILEKASNVFVVPAQMGWSDVGSWSALMDLKSKDANSNSVTAGDSAVIDSKGCLIHAPGKRVAAIGLENIIVVVEGDNILVCHRDSDQKVRQASEKLR